MIPGDTMSCLILAQTVAGTPATGLTLSGLTISGTLNGASVAISPALTEVDTIGFWRRYKLDVVVPALSGSTSVFTVTAQPTNPAVYLDTLRVLDGEIESVDLATVYSVVAAPVTSTVADGGPSGDLSLRFVKSTYASVSFTVTDQAGNAINLSAYTVPTLGIKSQDQTTTTYTQTTGISMTAGGLVTIAIPESASFYSALTTGVDSIQLYFTFVANEAGDASKTVCLARGSVVVVRSEV